MSDDHDAVDDDRLPSPLRPTLEPERDLVMERLQDAFARDAMSLDQFDERMELARTARRPAELVALVRDLPAPFAIPDRDALARAVRADDAPLVPTPGSALVPVRDAPVERISAVFGGQERSGRWTPPPRIRARAVFGGVELDFRRAVLAPGQVVEIDCSAVFGGVEIKVPAHVRVESRGTGVFGAFTTRHRDRDELADADAPVVRVRGWALFGAVDVEVKRERSRRQRALPRGRRRDDDDDDSDHDSDHER